MKLLNIRMDLFQYVIRENDTPESAIEKHRKLFDHATIAPKATEHTAQELFQLMADYEKYVGQSLKDYNKLQAGLERIKIGAVLAKLFASSDVADTFLNPKIPELPQLPGERSSTVWRKAELSGLEILAETIIQMAKVPEHVENKMYLTDQFRLTFLKQLVGCVRSGGLHTLIWQRLAENKRYNVILGLNRRQGAKVEIMLLQSLQRVQNDFVKAFLQERKFVINGQIIPHKQIVKILITATPLTDEEIPYFKEQQKIKTDEEFAKACDDVTNELMNNPFVQNDSGESSTVWSFLHPKIQSVTLHHLENGHYLDAVRCAVIELNDFLKGEYKSYTGDEEDGSVLMQKAFSPKNPIFIIADLSTDTGRNMQHGYMDIYAGAMRAMRNPVAHKNLVITQTECLEQLVLFSHLMHKYEKSAKPTV